MIKLCLSGLNGSSATERDGDCRWGPAPAVSCHYEAGTMARCGRSEPSGEESDPLCWVYSARGITG